jgi:hypothetical protein
MELAQRNFESPSRKQNRTTSILHPGLTTLRLRTKGSIRRATILIVLAVGAAGLSSWTLAQDELPFEVVNPKHKKWSADEANRIYISACELVARTVRPEKPPRLRPRFRLVLGADNDEFVNLSPDMEIHLKSWNTVKFAEAVALVASREVLKPDDLERIVHQSISLANSTVSVNQLKQNR